ncbi:MAG: CRTAC1 family protein [Bacteroidetes bacterium]|nr:CRTAC1 family protein [Bacteroidota bacterium]
MAVANCTVSVAQEPFLDVSNEMDIWTEHIGGYLGEGLSMADFNGDGLDDLSIAHHLGDLQFYVGDGEGFIPYELELTPYPHEAKCILWADIDNDGDQDLFITYRLAANKLYINEGDLQMTDVSAQSGLDQSNRRSYGACFGDYDNDGLLDLFIANYVSGQDPPYNELYRNLGDGYFEEVTFDGPMGEPLQQNFQGHWVDFNEDGLLDLHLIRDRICFENRYYKQAPNGEFFNDAHEMDLDYSINAMCTSTTDFDHDNDQDLYMSAGLWEGNYFVVNDGEGHFSPYEVESGDSVEVHLTSWAATWLDFDNDGWEDLHVCTGFSTYTSWPAVLQQYSYVPDNFFRNEGGYFEEDTTGQFDAAVLSFASVTGDFNQDGFPDLINNQVGEYAQVLQAIPNNNRWLKIMLEGTVSNRDGIGAKIRVYRNGLIGYHMTHCGENYLGQNSRWEHFGLGLASGVDSVTVHWPSGIIDSFYNLEPNQSLFIVEGETNPVIDPCSTGPCPGCTYPEACNFDASANEEDGSCDFSCLLNETTCGPGTIWDDSQQLCVAIENSCPTDLNFDGVTDVTDLLLFLASFAVACQ